MFGDGLDGCTFTKTALTFANDLDACAPTGSLQLRPSGSGLRLAAADQGRESPTPLKWPAMATLPTHPLPRPVITPSFLERLQIDTGGSFHCHAITEDLQALVERSGVRQGLLVAVGQHTTTALVLNENEQRLLSDIEAFFLALAPPDRPWLHNDLHLRQGIPPDEPRNAHAHLIAMLLGNQLSLPVVDGRLGIGRWQSVLLVELDGPRRREVLLQLIDTGGAASAAGEDATVAGPH